MQPEKLAGPGLVPCVWVNLGLKFFYKKITKNALVGLMIFQLDLIKILLGGTCS
jgi:hypothetical protein